MDNITKGIILTPLNLLYRIDPALVLKILFRLKVGYPLDLKDPKSFNEKIQWIKLNDKNPLMPKCVDKYTVRDYVKSKGLGDILNDTIWEGFDPKDIPFDSLPEKCVIKVTQGSTFNIICEDTSKLNREEVISKCRKWLKAKYLPCYGEWFHGIERPRVIVEKFLDAKPLLDYKFLCFNGIPRLVYVDTWKNGHTCNMYDMDFNFIEGLKIGYPNDRETPVVKPENWDRMVEVAKILSEDFRHVRVDLYNVNGQIYFGELTFTRGSGFGKITPVEWDYSIGDYLEL